MFRSRFQQALDCLDDRSARRAGLVIGAVFVFLYLYSVNNIVIAPGTDLTAGWSTPTASLVSNWPAKMWKQIAPFVWEPVGAFYPIPSLALFISVPNLLLALLLGGLVGLNTAIVVARARLMSGFPKRKGFLSSIFASLPALLTGITCCVPTIVLALGSLAAGFTVTAIAIGPYFLPVAVLALVVNLFWGLQQFSCAVKSPARKAPSGLRSAISADHQAQRGEKP